MFSARKKVVIDYMFLNKCLKAIQPQTWKPVKNALGAHCVHEACAGPTMIRTDTMVVECNIHWPIGSSLLWNTRHVAVRMLRRARQIHAASVRHRFHDRKIKRLHLTILWMSSAKMT